MSYSNFQREMPDKELNILNYNKCKFTLETMIDNNIKTIFLIGSGANGKSHLLQECKNNIIQNGYSLCDGYEILFGIQNGEEFETKMSMLVDKKIITELQNPYLKFNVEKPDNVVVIDMNHIRFC